MESPIASRSNSANHSKEPPLAAVKPIPDDYPRVNAYLCCDGAEKAIDFYVEALSTGATEEMPVMEMFWGDRMGTVGCPFGYKWSFATHAKDPTPDEMEAGAKAMMEQMAGGGD